MSAAGGCTQCALGGSTRSALLIFCRHSHARCCLANPGTLPQSFLHPQSFLRSLGIAEALKRSLLAQRVTAPNTAVNLIIALLSPLFNWLLIVRLGLGLDGAARECAAHAVPLDRDCNCSACVIAGLPLPRARCRAHLFRALLNAHPHVVQWRWSACKPPRCC